jgi:hypothetical protein
MATEYISFRILPHEQWKAHKKMDLAIAAEVHWGKKIAITVRISCQKARLRPGFVPENGKASSLHRVHQPFFSI